MIIAASQETFEAFMALARQTAAMGEPWAVRLVLENDCAKAMLAYCKQIYP
jgi:hypothetical protein